MWKQLFVLALFCLPAGAFCQELSRTDLDQLPAREDAPGTVVKRPDAQRLISELSTGLRLSSKQEDRISAAIKKKAAEFDKFMKEYDRSSEEEKRWRYKMNDAHYGMRRINQQIPDVVREYLDEEQREAYDAMLRPKPEPAAAVAAPAADAPKPLKKKRLVRRKRVPAPAPAAGAEDAAGEVMVDKDAAADRPAPRKPVKKAAARPEPAAEEPPADEPLSSGEEAEAPDPGSYP